jgi:selenocysteine lyase/cysteine desulfurase
MKFTLEDIYSEPNKLADHYKKFKVQERLLFTGHSHQAWPDCGFEGQKKAWEDASEFVDEKWERAFQKAGEVKKGYLKLLDDDQGNIALGSNTHELLIRFLSALPLKEKPKLVTSDGEFHSIRRQLDRLSEEGIEVIKVSSSPVNDVVEKIKKACDEKTSAVMVSSVFFNSGLILPGLKDLAEFCNDKNIKLLLDVYHALNVVSFSVKEDNLEDVFIVGGGYKYCQLGEGNCFLRFPSDTKMRPVITGWYSEFTALAEKKKPGQILYGEGDDLFAGATYDPTSHYRGAEVFNFFNEMNLTPEFLREVSQHQVGLLINEFDKLDLNPDIIKRNKGIDKKEIAGFLVLYSESASNISQKLMDRNVWIDYRGNALRFGPAPYISDVQIKDAMGILGENIKEVINRK